MEFLESFAGIGIERPLSEALQAALMCDCASEIAMKIARTLVGVTFPHVPLSIEQLNILVIRLLPLLDAGADDLFLERRRK